MNQWSCFASLVRHDTVIPTYETLITSKGQPMSFYLSPSLARSFFDLLNLLTV